MKTSLFLFFWIRFREDHFVSTWLPLKGMEHALMVITLIVEVFIFRIVLIVRRTERGCRDMIEDCISKIGDWRKFHVILEAKRVHLLLMLGNGLVDSG